MDPETREAGKGAKGTGTALGSAFKTMCNLAPKRDNHISTQPFFAVQGFQIFFEVELRNLRKSANLL